MPSPESPIDKSSMHRYCFYYQQGLNAESWSSPNAFLLQGNLQPKSPITLDLVKRSFPFGKMGTYHWRFRETCKEGGFIWRDVKDDAEELPKFQGVVFAKILRLDKLPRVTPTKIRINLSKKASRPASTPGPSASTSYSQASQQRPAPYSDHPPTKVQMPTVAEAASEPEAPPRAAPIAPAPAPPPAPPPVPETRVERLQRERKEREKNQEKVWDEVDQRWVVVGDKRNRSISPKPKASTTPVNDLLGGGTGSRPPSSSAPPPQMETVGAKVKGIKLDAANAVGKSANVAAGVQKRVKDMEDAQAKAKQELKDREDGKQRDAAELDAVRAQLEPKLKAWCEEYGKKRQLRALLSSLDKVLWPGSGWKPLNLGDVLDAKKARRAYLKASLKVHPDKTRDLNTEKRFIANRVFDALSQANAEFEANGGV